MKIIPLSEGTFTIDQTKKFVPFDDSAEDLKARPAGTLLGEIQPFVIISSQDILLLDIKTMPVLPVLKEQVLVKDSHFPMPVTICSAQNWLMLLKKDFPLILRRNWNACVIITRWSYWMDRV